MKRETLAIDPQRVKRLDEAADWILRLETPGRTESDYTDWLRWCDADPENLAAFETIQRTSQSLDALKTDPELSTEREFQFDRTFTPEQKRALLDQENITLLHPSTGDGRGAGGEGKPSRRREFFHRKASTLSTREEREGARDSGKGEGLRNRRAWAVAVGVGAIALALAAFYYRSTPTTASQQVAATRISRTATLPDGSKMILGAQSRVNMDFNGPKRQLDLSSGEAYFKVKHDKARPFVVKAGEVSVTAIGTAFDVRRNGDEVTVTVEEGVVEISSLSPRGEREGARDNGKGEGGRNTWRAEAGYQLIYSTRHRTASIASVNPSAELAWRNGELAYRNEPLGSVIEDLNRYSSQRIVIADPQIAKIPFTGTAFASSLDGWLAGIEQAYPVTVNRTANGDIILSSKQ